MSDLLESPTISVVCPFYNRMEFLPAIIATLDHQTYRDFELVVADDGSTDRLADSIEAANVDFPIQYVRLEKTVAQPQREILVSKPRAADTLRC